MGMIFKTYLKTVPLLLTGYLCMIVIQSMLPTCSVLVNAKFIDCVLQIDQEPAAAIMIVIFMFAGELIPDLKSFINDTMIAKMKYLLEKKMIRKIASLRYESIENSQTLDLISRVSEEPEKVYSAVLGNITSLVCFFCSALGPLLILLNYDLITGILSFVMMFPFAWFSVKGGRQSYETSKELAKKKRGYQYLSDLLTSREPVKERYLFGYAEPINQRYFSEFETVRKAERKPQLKWYFKSRSGGFLAVMLQLFIIGVMMPEVLKGKIAIGIFTSLITYFANFRSRVTWELPKLLYNFSRNREWVKDLKKVQELPANDRFLEPPAKEMHFEWLKFDKVSFAYPGTEKQILNDVSFVLEKGKHYAFAGENGAGKTTITKLLMGMYDQYTGSILVNGKELKSMTPEEIKGMFQQQYQDFARYEISLEDNIKIGNPENTCIENVISKVELEKILPKLPHGINTFLGKLHENSVDLSGGEWQRIAMARTVISTAPFKILDEPTAALDPLQEHYIYRQFQNLHQKTTTLLISHRLGAVINCDEIFVLDQGKIVESGSHEELLQKNGLYRSMFEKQKAWYK